MPLTQAGSYVPSNPAQGPAHGPSSSPIRSPSPSQDSEEKLWCLPKRWAEPEALQSNIDYVCGLGLDCGPIQEDGYCFEPNTVRAHAAFAMNLYYQVMGTNGYDCDFDQTGAITNVDPSNYLSSIISLFLYFLKDLFSRDRFYLLCVNFFLGI